MTNYTASTSSTNQSSGSIPVGLEAVDTALIFLSLLSTVPGLPIACLQLSYHLTHPQERATLVGVLYLLICVTDVTTLFCSIPITASLIDERKALLFANDIFCKAWGLIWMLLERYAMFLIALLSVTRSIVLYRPFSSSIGVCHIIWVILIYTALLTLHTSLILWNTDFGFTFTSGVVSCTIFLNTTIADQLFIVGLIVLILIPLVIVTISAIISVVSIKRSQRRSSGAFSINSQNRTSDRATRTILLLTFLYIFFNLPYFVYMLLICLYFNLSDRPAVLMDMLDFYGSPTVISTQFYQPYIFASKICMILNSTANVIIWTYRSEPMKAWVRGLFRSRRRSIRMSRKD